MPVLAGTARGKNGKIYQKGRFVKTEPHRIFLKKCRDWALLHNTAWEQVRDQIQEQVRAARAANKRFGFRIDMYFAFEDSRIWTAGNTLHRLDADNRLKPCRDALAALLEIDDKYFFGGTCEKVSADSKELECTYIRITQMTPRTLQALRMEVKQERDKATSFSAWKKARAAGSGT